MCSSLSPTHSDMIRIRDTTLKHAQPPFVQSHENLTGKNITYSTPTSSLLSLFSSDLLRALVYTIRRHRPGSVNTAGTSLFSSTFPRAYPAQATHTKKNTVGLKIVTGVRKPVQGVWYLAQPKVQQ